MDIANIPPCPNPKVEAPSAPFGHGVEIQTRFNDVDALGHINNSVYLEYMDLGKSRYFQHVAPERIDWRRVGVVVVNVNVDFCSPAYIHEPLCVLTRTTAIGDRSLRLEQRVVNSATGDVKCVGRTVMAGFDPEAAVSAPIAPEWVEAIERHEGRTLR